MTDLEKAEAALEAAWDAWHYLRISETWDAWEAVDAWHGSETWAAWEAVEAAKEAVMAAKAAQEKPE